jgi:asparagine synthase (glutamine-hydrolysing)
MSAQAGMWNRDGKAVDPQFCHTLSAALEQYGPDESNSHVAGSLAMLFRACYVTRESRLEKQPLITHAGNIITWDGRLDNRVELRNEIGGCVRTEQTDPGVVAAAYEKWDTDCFRRFRGDWAACIWDARGRFLLLARDYLGIRHLYYQCSGTCTIWCSMLSAFVLSSGLCLTVDDQYVAGYLANYPDPERTPCRQLLAVPPAHFVKIDQAGISKHAFWSLNASSSIRYPSDADYEEHFRHLFRQAVRRRLNSDRPVLAELSGGVDSSSVVCMADDILASGEPGTPLVHTISLYDSAEPKADERAFVNRIEARRGRVGLHVDLAQYHSQFFQGVPGFVPAPGFFWDCRPVERERDSFRREYGCRASLSGVGGDELMGGVPDPRPELADLLLMAQPFRFCRLLFEWSRVKRQPWVKLLLQSSLLMLPTTMRARYSHEGRHGPWINSEFARRNHFSARLLGVNGVRSFHLPTRAVALRTLHAISSQLSSALPSLIGFEEKQYPYLDQDLVEFVLSIPGDQLLRPGARRSLMRRALADIVPSDILNRRSKGIAARRYMVAFETNWTHLCELFDQPLSSAFGYTEPEALRNTLVSVKNGEITPMLQMMKVISLELWLRDLVSRNVIEIPQMTHERLH